MVLNQLATYLYNQHLWVYLYVYQNKHNNDNVKNMVVVMWCNNPCHNYQINSTLQQIDEVKKTLESEFIIHWKLHSIWELQ